MEVKKGSKVQVHYTGTLDDGSVFDSSRERQPFEFVMGENQVIPGFEKAVDGLNPGDQTTTKIPSTEAYGPHRQELVNKIDRKTLPADLKPNKGDRLTAHAPNGQQTDVTVIEISDQEITVDANHPLAGKNLTFEIEVLSVS